MYNSTPAAACRVPDLLKLKPVEQGATVMIRDSKAAKDGWFWGWYGWPDVKSGWHVDFPPVASNPLPFMGFGQYCMSEPPALPRPPPEGIPKARKLDQAIEVYESSTTINTGLVGPRRKLASLLSRRDPNKAMRENDAINYIFSFYRGL